MWVRNDTRAYMFDGCCLLVLVMQFSQEITDILTRPASQWTNDEGQLIYKIMVENGRETVKQALDEARAVIPE
jgi:hypothetical protein